MTSAQFMLAATQVLRVAAVSIVVLGLGVLGGCGVRKAQIHPPNVLVAPYDTSRGDVLWAVVPPLNESGTSTVDATFIADQVVATITEARGLQAVPINRTIAGMRAVGIERVTTPTEAKDLARALGADGVVTGTITAYDPYDPPSFGLTLALFGRDGAMSAKTDLLDDPRVFSMQATDARQRELTGYDDQPLAVAARHLDARSHDVLIRLKQYAEGRTEPDSPLDWRIHKASMDLYTKFATFTVVGELLDIEWTRLARTARMTTSDPG